MTQVNTVNDNYIIPSTPAQLVTGLGLEAGGARDIWVEKGGDTMTGALTMSGANLEMNRLGGNRSGISWYSSGYKAWSTYMAAAGQTGVGPHGDITAPSGSLVTSWALRNFVENNPGYGWTFESGTSAGNPTVVAEIRSSDGSIRTLGDIYASNFKTAGVGFNNTFVGPGTGDAITTGVQNTAIGSLALAPLTTGTNNTANGYQALRSNTTGSDNTANGSLALYSNTTGFNNTANGDQALYSNTTGSNNTVNGLQALYSNTTGSNNTVNGAVA